MVQRTYPVFYIIIWLVKWKILSDKASIDVTFCSIDIFQKLAAVKDQREWVIASGAHKVSTL